MIGMGWIWMNLCLAGLQGELLLQTSVQCRGDFWRTETYLHPAFAFFHLELFQSFLIVAVFILVAKINIQDNASKNINMEHCAWIEELTWSLQGFLLRGRLLGIRGGDFICFYDWTEQGTQTLTA